MSPEIGEVILCVIGGLWLGCCVLCAVLVWQETRAGARAAKARARRRLEDYRMQQHAQSRGMR